MEYKNKKTGFTLIELSIVLVIISLIVGGVISGKSLIISSEVQNIARDLLKYQTALRTFNLQYDALAGDFSEATSYWPSCIDEGTNLCNGNGNGRFSFTNGGVSEGLRAWQHLGLAQILNKSYTGGASRTIDERFPISGLDTTVSLFAWGFADTIKPNQTVYGKAGNAIHIMANKGIENRHFITIDKKLDDGKMRTGKISGLDFNSSLYPISSTDEWLTTGVAPTTFALLYWQD